MITNLLTIAGSIGAILTILGAAAKFYKTLRRIEDYTTNSASKDDIKKLEEHNSKQDETSKCIVRHAITQIYYDYKEKKQLPDHVRQDLCYLYNQYKELNGNSYVAGIMKQMEGWDTIE